MKQLTIRIETNSPVILSTKGNTKVMTATHDYFAGSVIRGLLASRYIQQAGLGKEAHNDEQFISLFFNELHFVDAYPVNSATGTRSIPLPLSLQKIKDGTSIIDLLKQDSEPNYKSLRGFGAIEQGKIYATEIKKSISLHMSRSDMRNANGTERLAGRSTQSGIYNYESLAPGQVFEGYVFGSEDDLGRLVAVLQGSEWTAHVGRSHYTQYGSCLIQLGDIQPAADMPFEGGRSACLRLDTPLLVAEHVNDAESALQEIAARMNELGQTSDFHILKGKRKIFSKAEKIDSFVGVWGMKRPRLNALAAGTIFILEKDSDWTEADKAALTQLCYEGIGLRTEEGFGQVRVWQCTDISFTKPKEKAAIEKHPVKNKLAASIAKKILTKKIAESVRIFAAEDVASSKKTFPKESKHLFTRLDGMLGKNPAHSRSHLQNALLDEKGGANTPLSRFLRKVEVNGISLEELLENTAIARMPYNKRDWLSVLSPRIDEAIADIDSSWSLDKITSDEELFYEYWHWFFRHGRKTELPKGVMVNE